MGDNSSARLPFRAASEQPSTEEGKAFLQYFSLVDILRQKCNLALDHPIAPDPVGETRFRKSIWSGLAALHDSPIDGSGDQNCEHRGPYFLIWHHAYLTAVEEYARKFDQFKNFSMPYWNPSYLSDFPPQFLKSGPTTTLLNEFRWAVKPSPKRFESVGMEWRSLGTPLPSTNLFCATSDLGLPILGKFEKTYGNDQSGFVEKLLHDPIHEKPCPEDQTIVPCSGELMKIPDTAALDPIFHPFHAGVDFMFADLLERAQKEDNSTLQASLCRMTVAGRTWWKHELKVPNSKCAGIEGQGSCQIVNGRLPYETVTVGDVLSQDRFWSTPFKRPDGTMLRVRPPCEGIPPSPGDGSVSCPISPIVVSFNSTQSPHHSLLAFFSKKQWMRSDLTCIDEATQDAKPGRAEFVLHARSLPERNRFEDFYNVTVDLRDSKGKLIHILRWKNIQPSEWLTGTMNHGRHQHESISPNSNIVFSLEADDTMMTSINDWSTLPNAASTMRIWRRHGHVTLESKSNIRVWHKSKK